MSMAYIVHGPMNCGKTRNSGRIASKLKVCHVVDDWDGRQHKLVEGAVHLTNQPVPDVYRGTSFIEIIEYSDLDIDAWGTERNFHKLRAEPKRRVGK